MSSSPHPFSSSATPKKPSPTTMTPGVRHPETGKPLSAFTARCGCGGITGICGSSKGSSKWKAHIRTVKHAKWESTRTPTATTPLTPVASTTTTPLSPH
ncbi:expressed unknown protein [Seminavis robusta]|uniref:Uncharacterized protein n=1 Tax=Seminavis robusta TaxID=568900 RepID=A0A9N8HPH5_9STRA|nr:expressed unknown protein [Seminavis robusta]|eukprot:Sro1180_g249770.1 n/a (99) ;mRNA; f:26374-26670